MDSKKLVSICLAMALAGVAAGCNDDVTQPTSCDDVTCEAGQVCDPTTFKCVDDSKPEDKCKDVTCDEGQTCNKDTGKCEGGSNEPECSTNDDCKDSTKPVCENGSCIPDPNDVEDITKTCVAENNLICEVNGEKFCIQDKLTDEQNCGTCGNECSANQKCDNGECKSSLNCVGDEIECEGELACVSKNTDNKHCGNCETSCNTAEGENCLNGVCVKPQVECEETDTVKKCGAECVDITNAVAHCGACNNACQGNETCENSQCTLNCDEPMTACTAQHVCANLATDHDNCGACGNKCGDDQKCSESTCVDICDKTGGTPNLCGTDTCVNFQNDNDNCGACGNKCLGDTSCSGGVCSDKCEVEGEIRCNGKCINPKTDKDFCGASDTCDVRSNTAGTECANACDNGQCVACPDPNSNDTCGCTVESAGLKCAELPNTEGGACSEGKCAYECQEGFADCDDDPSNGCETRINTTDNCGGCGNICGDDNASSASCDLGLCELTCNDDLTACIDGGNGSCADLQKDVNNCGFCGNVCDTENGQSCVEGACVVTQCGSDGYVSYNVTTYDGTSKTVRAYCIDSLEKLKELQLKKAYQGHALYPDNGNVDDAYILLDNIKLSGSSWEPIQLEQSYFLGNGKTISSTIQLTMSTQTGAKAGGFFSTVSQSVVDNVRFELNVNASSLNKVGIIAGDVSSQSVLSRNVVVGSASGASQVGGLVGYANISKIDRCSFEGTVNSTNGYTGGLVGRMSNTEISNSAANNVIVAATSGSYNGGIVGYVENTSKISNSTASGELELHNTYGGGIAGWMSNADIVGSKSSVKVKGDYTIKNQNGTSSDQAWSYMGGLAGYTKIVTIKQSEASGDVFGHSYVGGLVGDMNNTTVISSQVLGNVTGRASYIGGLAGRSNLSSMSVSDVKSKIEIKALNSSIQASYIGGVAGYAAQKKIDGCTFTGSITLPNNNVGTYFGGLVGQANAVTVKKSSASVSQVIGVSYVGGLIGHAYGQGGSVEDSTVTGNTVTAVSNFSGGLIGYAENINISGSKANPQVYGTTNVGGLVGRAINCKISDSEATGNVTGTSNMNGGLVGYAVNGTSISKSKASGSVKGTSYIGGLVGYIGYTQYANASYPASPTPGTNNNVNITESVATGSVEQVNSSAYCGGLVGYAGSGLKIDSSEAKGAVICNSSNVGGLVGHFYGGNGAYVKNSSANNTVRGGSWVGGFIGGTSTTHTVENCISSGTVTGTSSCVGGFIGHAINGTYRNSIAYGTTTTTSSWVGGFVGHNNTSSNFYNCAAIGTVDGFTESGGGFLGHSYSPLILKDVMAIVDVTGAGMAGGLAGSNTTSKITVTNAYSYGSVTSTANSAGLCIGQNQASTGNTPLSNVYWWNKANNLNKIVGSQSYAPSLTNGSASYEVSGEDNRAMVGEVPLVNKLGAAWTEAKCSFNAGDMDESSEATLPVLIGVVPNHNDYIKCTIPSED